VNNLCTEKTIILRCTRCDKSFGFEDAQNIHTWDNNREEVIILKCECGNISFYLSYKTGRKANEVGEVIAEKSEGLE